MDLVCFSLIIVLFTYLLYILFNTIICPLINVDCMKIIEGHSAGEQSVE